MLKFQTSLGDFFVELHNDDAPVTTKNFMDYVTSGHFDGTVFHRVIPGFVIQGGGMTADMNQKKTRAPIKNEASNGLKNRRGSLSMARTNDPNSAGSQFFICLEPTSYLDGQYTAFGKTADAASLDVVRKIGATPTGPGDRPRTPVTIKQATVLSQPK